RWGPRDAAKTPQLQPLGHLSGDNLLIGSLSKRRIRQFYFMGCRKWLQPRARRGEKRAVQRAADSGARRLRGKIALLEAGSYAHNAGALLLHAHDLSAADKLPVSSRVGHGESHFDFGVKFRNKFAVKENDVEI